MRSTLTNLANMFRVPDLRNKILFTLFIITVYRLGSNIPCPGIDFSAVQSLAASASHAGVVSFLNLFSGGALTKFAVFGLGIMPYITSSIIIQLMIVVIPKFEQWREEGAVGQKKLTQVTRYLTIALAHYGLLEQPEELLAEAEETLTLWAETAESAYREGSDIAGALAARFDPLLGDVDPSHKEKLDIMNGVHSNAAGFRRWLEGRDAARS
jgi:hypothetical protein